MKIIASLLVVLFSFKAVSADFSDTQYSWYKTSITALEKAGVVSGQSDGSYQPDWLITRAEMLKIIMRVSETPLLADSMNQCFPDVDPVMWYSKYICTAHKLGVAKGFSNGTFGPNETITDLEALAFGFRAFGIAPTAVAGQDWYEAYRDLANKNNILATHSYTLGTKISRAKAAELIMNIGKFKLTRSPLGYASPGCTLPEKALEATNTILINGVARKYNLSVPSGYSKDKEYNLVVALHGRTNSNDMVQNYMGLQAKAGGWNNKGGPSQTDSIVAYPAGVKVSGGYSWSDTSNVTFFDAILQQISDNYCINRDHVFIVGHSLGGWFANKLACVRGDVINGMTSVGGPGYGGKCTGPVASLIFHNANDPLVAYASGKYAEATRKTVNQCGNTSTPIMIGSFQCKQWNDCTSGNPVTWCEGYATYQNDPHGWPKSGGNSMLNFFSSLGEKKFAL